MISELSRKDVGAVFGGNYREEQRLRKHIAACQKYNRELRQKANTAIVAAASMFLGGLTYIGVPVVTGRFRSFMLNRKGLPTWG